MKKFNWKQIGKGSLPIILAIVFAFSLIYFVRPLQVAGESMEPTFRDGQWLAASRALKGTAKKGDIITAKVNPTKETPADKLINGKLNIIKRIIGAPGDTVDIKNNAVYVNGKKIDEPYLNEPMKTPNYSCKLKADEWFIMGDNRNHSLDSRKIGPIRTEEISFIILNG